MGKDAGRYLKLGVPDNITIEIENDTAIKNAKNRIVDYGRTKVEFTESDGYVDVFITSSDELKSVKLRWAYQFSRGARFLADAWERGYGDFEWRGMSKSRFMPWYFLAAVSGETWCFGVRVRPSAMCYWQADAQGISLHLDVRCGGRGVLLENRTLHAARILCSRQAAGTALEAARNFCRLMCPDPVFPAFPVYGSNNWYYAYGDSSEKEILEDAKYILGLADGCKNPPFMVIDDGWQEHHRQEEYNGGPWTKGNEKFPDMERLACRLKEMGVRPGIWARLLLNEDQSVLEAGRLVHNRCLDPSNPEIREYIRKDVQRICGWGYTLIKHDFSTYDLFGKWGFEMKPLVTEDGWSFYDRHKTSAEIVKQFYRTVAEAAGEYGALVLGCNTIGHLGAGLMHLSRVGDDTSGLCWEQTRRMGINSLAFRLAQHGTFFHIDADCVGITGDIPWEMNRQWAEALALSGTPLFVSPKPGILDEKEYEELHQIMQTASEQKKHMVPLDWEDTDCPGIWGGDGTAVSYKWYEDS